MPLLELALIVQAAASANGAPRIESVVELPEDPAAIVISDLGVRVTIPQEEIESFTVLGLDADAAVLLWGLTPRGEARILRFDSRTGAPLSSSPVAEPFADAAPVAGRLVLDRASGEIFVLRSDTLGVIGLDGRVIDSFELPFVPTSILAAHDGRAHLAGTRAGAASPIHLFLRSDGRVVSAAAPKEGVVDERAGLPRAGVLDARGRLWTAGAGYRLERWDPQSLTGERVLHGHPAALTYLLGPYADVRIMNLHITDERFLWSFIRLRSRTPLPGPFESDEARFAAEYDGLLEVIDLETSAVVANRYVRDFEVGGWLHGPIGYRVVPGGGLEWVHMAIEPGDSGVTVR